MAQKCVFCGREIGLFSRENIVCGGVEQPSCSECHQLLRNLSQKERGERALATGRAVDPERIVANLEQAEQREKEDRERQERARQAIRTGKTCLRCGGPMERYGHKLFHLGDEGLFGPVARDGLFASWLGADVLRCAQCGWAEFYLPDPPELPDDLVRKEDTVTCPVCGREHSVSINCPWCAMRGGAEKYDSAREEPKTKGGRQKPGSKPPWEK